MNQKTSDLEERILNTLPNLAEKLSNWIKRLSFEANGQFTDATLSITIAGIQEGSIQTLAESLELAPATVDASAIRHLIEITAAKFEDVFTIEDIEWSIVPIENAIGKPDCEIHISASIHLAT